MPDDFKGTVSRKNKKGILYSGLGTNSKLNFFNLQQNLYSVYLENTLNFENHKNSPISTKFGPK